MRFPEDILSLVTVVEHGALHILTSQALYHRAMSSALQERCLIWHLCFGLSHPARPALRLAIMSGERGIIYVREMIKDLSLPLVFPSTGSLSLFSPKGFIDLYIAAHEVATGSLRKCSCRFTFSQCFPKDVTFSTECSVSAHSSRDLSSGNTIHLELRGFSSHSNRCSLWNVTRTFSDFVERNMFTKRI